MAPHRRGPTRPADFRTRTGRSSERIHHQAKFARNFPFRTRVNRGGYARCSGDGCGVIPRPRRVHRQHSRNNNADPTNSATKTFNPKIFCRRAPRGAQPESARSRRRALPPMSGGVCLKERWELCQSLRKELQTTGSLQPEPPLSFFSIVSAFR